MEEREVQGEIWKSREERARRERARARAKKEKEAQTEKEGKRKVPKGDPSMRETNTEDAKPSNIKK